MTTMRLLAIFVLLLLMAVPNHAAEPSARPDLATVDIAKAPWSAVGRINNSAYGRCSAILVRPDIALTAAHCLYNIASRRFLQPASIHILFGFSKGQYGFHTTVAEITIGKDYVPGGVAASAPYDWAVLRLSKAAPSGFVPMEIAAPATSPLSSVRAAGFGQERSEVLTATGPCRVLTHPAASLLVTDCNLSHGFSGGPMIETQTGRLVGISVAVRDMGDHQLGIAVPIASLAGALPPG